MAGIEPATDGLRNRSGLMGVSSKTLSLLDILAFSEFCFWHVTARFGTSTVGNCRKTRGAPCAFFRECRKCGKGDHHGRH